MLPVRPVPAQIYPISKYVRLTGRDSGGRQAGRGEDTSTALASERVMTCPMPRAGSRNDGSTSVKPHKTNMRDAVLGEGPWVSISTQPCGAGFFELPDDRQRDERRG
jgi:hypothetical protein